MLQSQHKKLLARDVSIITIKDTKLMMEVIVRTSVTMSEETMAELMRFSEASTKTEAVNRAVEEWVRLRKAQELRSMRGKLSFERGIEEIRETDIEELEDLGSYGAG